MPACLFLSCDKDTGREDVELVELQVDSCHVCIKFAVHDMIADTASQVRSLDLLIYKADGIKELRDKRHYDFLPDSILIYGPREDLVAVAIANYPQELFSCPPERFEEAEGLICDFESDSPGRPLMSASCNIEQGEGASLMLIPLMSKVKLGQISNNQKKYVRLEDPRIYLENVNASAEILRLGGFRPAELLQAPVRAPLPYDIGIFTQSPGTELFCYPNDSAEATIGTPSTVLVLECEIKGETCRFSTSLPAIRRNTVTYVDISVNGPGDFESKVY
ncbi:MAG: hypothetical protein J6O51_08280 [Bacteroidales bacterium]|nr:hypothetical protein [Bacteroidales bacterium]